MFSRYLNFCLGFLVIWEKQLNLKDKINFKVYDVKTWLTNTMHKFVQVKEKIFCQKSCRDWGWETSSRPFQKAVYEVKASGLRLAWFKYISIAHNLAYNINKLCKTLDYWSRDMLNFRFSQKGLGIVSPSHFVYDFSKKVFLILYSINWPNFIDWLPLLLEILGNMCISIVC